MFGIEKEIYYQCSAGNMKILLDGNKNKLMFNLSTLDRLP